MGWWSDNLCFFFRKMPAPAGWSLISRCGRPMYFKHVMDCFYTRAKVRNLNYHSNDGILDRVYAKLHRDVSFEMHNSNDGPDHHLNCTIQITHRDVSLRTHGPKYCHLNDHSNCTLCSHVKTDYILLAFSISSHIKQKFFVLNNLNIIISRGTCLQLHVGQLLQFERV